MKYLENIQLEDLTKTLQGREIGGLVLSGRCELYSMKKAGTDKKEAKELERKMSIDSAANFFDSNKPSPSLFIDLVQTLNASLIDYDFTDLKPENFVPVKSSEVVREINSQLAELTVEKPNFLSEMWHNVDTSMGGVSNCEAFKLSADPFDEETASVWSFHFFLYNKELKRICYLQCEATHKCHAKDYDSDDEVECDDEDDFDGTRRSTHDGDSEDGEMDVN
jgi:Maf1 regulator